MTTKPKAETVPDAAAAKAPPECFVIMPISDPDGYGAGHFERVFQDIFVPACDTAGYRAIRADDVLQTNLIHLDILQRLLKAPLALCDLSARNPNVMFELGLRQAFDMPVVLVQETDSPPIFDIAPLRSAKYRRARTYHEVLEDQVVIAKAIVATADAASNAENVNSLVKLLALSKASIPSVNGDEQAGQILQIFRAELSSLKDELRTIRTQGGDLFTPRPRKLDIVTDETMLAIRSDIRDIVGARGEWPAPEELANHLMNAYGISKALAITLIQVEYEGANGLNPAGRIYRRTLLEGYGGAAGTGGISIR